MKRIIPYLTIGLFLCSCTQVNYRTDSGMTWGTTYHITYQSAMDMSDSIIRCMQEIDQSLSPFVETSQLSRINRNEGDMMADIHLRQVLDLSQKVCSLSHGAFDPTVAPLVNLWGFGYKNMTGDHPTMEMIDSALTTVGIRECYLADNGAIVKKSPDTEFNFSAVAKGYGVDQVAEMLQRNGCFNYMVEIGGEIALSGNSSRGGKWNIQIDAPVQSDNGELKHSRLKVIQLSDRCIATSGNYRNYRQTSEGQVGHTISPISGMPVATRTLSATIIAPNTALADALATAVMAMEPQTAVTMLRDLPEVEALIVLSKPDGEFEFITTPHWPGQ